MFALRTLLLEQCAEDRPVYGHAVSKATGPNMMINISRLDYDDQVSCLAPGGFRTGLLLLPLTHNMQEAPESEAIVILENWFLNNSPVLLWSHYVSKAVPTKCWWFERTRRNMRVFVFYSFLWRPVVRVRSDHRPWHCACAGTSVDGRALQVCTNSTGPKLERWHFWLTTGEIQLQTVLSVPVLTWAGGSSPSTKVCPWPCYWAIVWPSPILLSPAWPQVSCYLEKCPSLLSQAVERSVFSNHAELYCTRYFKTSVLIWLTAIFMKSFAYDVYQWWVVINNTRMIYLRKSIHTSGLTEMHYFIMHTRSTTDLSFLSS